MSDFVHVESPTEEEFPVKEQSPKKGQDDVPIDVQSLQLGETATSGLKFLDTHSFVRSTVVDKIYGCLIGSALGDTIGLYTEFLPKQACETAYKERKFSLVNPVTEWYPDTHRTRFEPCAWTDDTDQSLLILLSYVHNHSTSTDPITNLPSDFATRLLVWIEQGLRALDRPPCGIGALVGGVVTDKSYLSNPAETATKRWVKSARHVAPNGSLMRTHPIGVIGIGMSEEEVWKLAAGVGMTTHADPRCTVACCISVGLIRGLLRGEISTEEDVDAAIERAYTWMFTQPELINPGLDSTITEWEIKRHLDRKEFDRHVYAQTYEELKLDSHREMGYVYKCLGSAVLALRLCIRAAQATPLPSKTLFEDLMTDLIMEGGDSDTNGAAAGALIGAYLGYANLPPHWALGLAHKEWLSDKILRLIKVLGVLDGKVATEIDEAPDGGKGMMGRSELERRDQAMLALILERKRVREEKEKKAKEKGKGFLGLFST